MLKEDQVNKRELVGAVAAHTDSDAKSAQKIVDGTIDVILATVAKGEVVNLSGFAKFERKSRPARLARNPQTGATVKVPAKKVAKITALKGFKDVALGVAKPPKLAAIPVKRQAPGRRVLAAKKAPVKRAAPAKKAPVKKVAAKKAPAARAGR
jgi:DNA-binding protein HU-beta